MEKFNIWNSIWTKAKIRSDSEGIANLRTTTAKIEEQLPERDQDDLDQSHHELKLLHEEARSKIKSKKRQIIRAQEAAKEQNKAAATAQRETTARQNRITSIQEVLTQLYARQDQEMLAMDGKIVTAVNFASLAGFAAGFKILHERLVQVEGLISEISELDPTQSTV